jgi:hypothetical protein
MTTETTDPPVAADQNQAIVTGPCYYFGCGQGAGHYLFSESGQHCWSRDAERSLPIRYTVLDGGLLPPGKPETEGEAAMIHVGNWTIITFWDRSVDKRGGCNSSFVIPARLGFDDAVALSRKRFPWVWSRFKFDVRLSQ